MSTSPWPQKTAKVLFMLEKNDAEKIAREAISKYLFGSPNITTVNRYDVLEEICRIIKADGLDAVFARNDNGTMVFFSLEEMECAIEHSMPVLPQ